MVPVSGLLHSIAVPLRRLPTSPGPALKIAVIAPASIGRAKLCHDRMHPVAASLPHAATPIAGRSAVTDIGQPGA